MSTGEVNLVFSPDARRQLLQFRVFDQRRIVDAIRQQLIETDPRKQTRHKFALDPPPEIRTMKMISVTDAQLQLPDLVDAVKEGPVLLLRKGRPCAALVGLGERFDPEAFSLGRNKRLRQRMDEACRRTRETGGIPFSEILAEVERQETGRKPRPARRRAKNS